MVLLWFCGSAATATSIFGALTDCLFLAYIWWIVADGSDVRD